MAVSSVIDAQTVALQFLVDDLEIPKDDQDFFDVIAGRSTDDGWYVVEIGVAGLPDKWVLQVFDTGQCDPCYTFISPMPAGEDADLDEFPPRIAEILSAERTGQVL